MARDLGLLVQLVNPGRVRNLQEVESGITAWDEKVKQLQSMYDEQLVDMMEKSQSLRVPCQ